MNTSPFRMSLVRSLVLVAAAWTCGCSILGAPAPDASRYFVLASGDGQTIEAPPRQRPDVHFGLGPVRLPGYLDTQSLVRTGPNGSVDYLPNAFWAEPLQPGFARALLYRTGARLGTTHGVAYPWYSTTRVDWKVAVDVLRFEATSDGRAVLVARWSVQRSSDSATVASGESPFEESAGKDPADVVAGLSRCIDRLAETIAAAIPASPATASPAQGAGPTGKGRSAR